MGFTEPVFVAFLAVVLAVSWSLRGARARNAFLLAASAAFYGWVHPWWLALLAGSILLDFAAGLAMERWPARKRLLLAASITANLGVLATFKYLGFFLDSVSDALALLGLHPGLPVLRLALPAGISFFTFQTMSYTIDVYRGRIPACRDLLDYATFVTLFPQLVAGPIERARDLLPQVQADRTFDPARVRRGLGLALWGAVQKVVVADTVGLYVDRVFVLPDPSGLMVAAATVGFAVQILADFGGYTNIARGTGAMLGFSLVENFRAPYAATTPSDFWRRWHISFSSWIHEYVYVPLGGSRHGPARTALATTAAMLLSGLWHGAAWHFVAWGAFHAALLLAYRALTPRVPAALRDAPLSRPAAVGLMFAFTCVGWLLFRTPSLNHLAAYARAPLYGGFEQWVAACVVASIAAAGGLVLLLGGRVREHLAGPAPFALRTTLWAVAGLAVFVCARDTTRDFLYFRF